MEAFQRSMEEIFGSEQVICNPEPKNEQQTLPCVKLSNGMFLTLRERKIMLLLLDEADARKEVFHIGTGPNDFNQQLQNAYLLIGDYIAAYKRGDINRSDFERCG